MAPAAGVVFQGDRTPAKQMVVPQLRSAVPEAFAKDTVIAWFRGEFAAANAIIDALCSHLQELESIGGGGEYGSVFAAIHLRRQNWVPILQMQKYYPIVDVTAELEKVAEKKREVVVVCAEGGCTSVLEEEYDEKIVEGSDNADGETVAVLLESDYTDSVLPVFCHAMGIEEHAIVSLEGQDENQLSISLEPSLSVVGENVNHDILVEKAQTLACYEGDITCLSASLVGLKRENIDDIYHIYCNHAAEVGFSVRKSQTKYNVAKVLVQKWFVCSCEGTRKKKTPNLMNKEAYKRPYITRTNCKAILKAKLNDEGVYEVFEHNMDHNHILSRKEWSYMHRSERSISSEKAVVIEDLVSSGLKATDSFRYMVYDAGGEHIIGHTKKDHLNFVNKLKMEAIEGGDAQTLIDNLSQQSAEDVDFFYRVKLDDDGRLCNVFWRDSMMKEDYMIYGDVVVFDTTYRTNRYNLICAPFVGINNHWKNVMFGCAFISNEKTESFEWLFEVFKKSMGGQSPITLFTDQDKAIANGIEKAFPTTRHRLCIWHLYQNAISHFGKLKSDKGFNEAFQKCLTGCSSGEEFEDCWRSMIEGYSLQDNSWFARLYCLREKWSTGYNKDFFSAGILSSQRSESTNHALGFNAKKTTSLSDFYIIFQKTVEQWRSTEAKDEFQCSRANPTSCLALTGLLKHASEIYTLTLFRFFESEFLKSISTSTKLLCEDGGFQTYQVTESDGITSHCVSFYAFGNLVSCSCKNFEECGLLCCHSLRILHAHSVPQIPDCYIKRRWRKFVKQDIWDKSDGNSTPKKFQKCAWRNQMMRKYYNLILKAQESEEARKAVEDGFNSVVPVVDALVTREKTSDAVEETCSSHQNVLDPSHSITKGRKKERIKAHQKTKKSKTSNPSSSTPSKEFGTKTPNPRSF